MPTGCKTYITGDVKRPGGSTVKKVVDCSNCGGCLCEMIKKSSLEGVFVSETGATNVDVESLQLNCEGSCKERE